MTQQTLTIKFEDLLNAKQGEDYICSRLADFERDVDAYLRPWRHESIEKAYPSRA